MEEKSNKKYKNTQIALTKLVCSYKIMLTNETCYKEKRFSGRKEKLRNGKICKLSRITKGFF